ncbi:MAG: 4'-phosphopantetheinyl transferase superfamily protein [Tannerella sp.]|jgi:phosphopantetheinyl transferase|nr:4'-phosphopantetheinyl transferase superfamily protein [Tannerella sp.]
MPVLQKYASPLWGVWKIEESWERLLHLSEWPEKYLPFLNNCKSDSRKAEWLAVRILLKELTGAETTVAYHADGFPYLPDAPYHISISHTKGYAAVLLNPDKPVGIDIEYRSERIQKIKSRFLNETEWMLLGENPGTTDLLICWSAKETAFKMTERKVADWQKDIHIMAFDFSRETGFLTVKETLTPQSATYQIQYGITPDFVITRSE